MKRTDHTALKLGDTATAAVAGRLLPTPSPRPITHCVQHVASLLAICLMLTIHTFSHAQAQVPPGGVPLFGENPLAAFSFEGETDGNGAAAMVLVNGQPFSEALRVRVQRKPSNPGRIRLNLSDGTVAPVAAGDVLLATFFVRGSVGSPTEISKPVVRFVLEQTVSPEERLVDSLASAGDDWTQVHIPFLTLKVRRGAPIRRCPLAAKRFMSFSGRPHVLEPQKGPDCATIQL